MIQKALTKFKELWPLLPAAIYLLSFLIVVLAFLIALSLSGQSGSGFPSLQTAASIFAKKAFWDALLNTLIFAAIGTPLELAVGLYFALIVYGNFAMRNAIRSFFLIPLAIPALVTAILLFILFDYPGGHINHVLLGKYPIFPALLDNPVNWRGSQVFALGISLFGKVWRDMPISMLIILAGLSSIDPELFDAAKTMGAGWRRQLRHIIIPLIMPSISAVVLLRSIEMWKEFIFPFVLAGRYNLLGTLIESLYNDWGYPNEAALVALVLVVCIVITTILLLAFAELSKRLLTGK